MAWNKERIELLKKCWAEGLSGSQCAARIGGVTRNAVIGKSMRLGLPRRAPCGAQSSRSLAGQTKVRTPRAQRKKLQWIEGQKRPKLRPEPFVSTVAMPVVPPAERKSFADLEIHHCHWPYGEGPFQFCGRKKLPGLSYCEGHARVAYRGALPKELVKPIIWKERVFG